MSFLRGKLATPRESAGDGEWPRHERAAVMGALADAGDLPGDMLPSVAIRTLTRERDEAVALLLLMVDQFENWDRGHMYDGFGFDDFRHMVQRVLAGLPARSS